MRFVDVETDYRLRPEPETLIRELERLNETEP